MATLLIPLVGPLQSWGLDSRFDLRLTAQEPSFSGVIGLVCAALGRDRSESVADLAALNFGVRADAEGVLLRDFHTVQGCITASGKVKEGDAAVTTRWYLADAAFTAALEGPAVLLGQIGAALRNPVWGLALGRKACIPTVPLGCRCSGGSRDRGCPLRSPPASWGTWATTHRGDRPCRRPIQA